MEASALSLCYFVVIQGNLWISCFMVFNQNASGLSAVAKKSPHEADWLPYYLAFYRKQFHDQYE
jgi:hypothetical protein